MTEARFDIVFRGEISPEFDRHHVMKAFANTFRMAPEKAAKIFQRSSTTLKKDLNNAKAAQYQKRLRAMGMEVHIEARTNLEEPSAPAATQDANNGFSLLPTSDEAATEVPRTADSGNGDGAFTARNPAAEPSRPEARLSAFRFSGEGRDYFGIWIVNLLLSVLTLGIYSAWAKVRNKQYFYGHTELEGSRFDYTASAKRILLGRCIALVFFIVYSIALEVSLASAVIAWLLFLAFLPWAVRQALRFNARHSQYRNVPFRFEGSLLGAFLTFIVWPVAGSLTFGLLFPMALQRQQAYILGNHAYGTRSFKFTAPVRAYYRMALWLLAWLVVGAAVIGLLTVLGVVVLAPLVGIALYFVLFALFSVTMANLKFNHTTLARHGFEGRWETGSYMRMVVVNSLATVFTLGLFIPWARVRTARYAAEHTEASIMGDLEDFTRAEAEKTSAIAEGMGDLFDLDVGA